ncbi:MAG: hypothetical protein ACRC1T_05440 [Clostridium chrysemydis]|uniref:hypothetical protein n=1 Tax=Clostridium chrysemydis TaxID=2665504 RepID=UPI003F2B8491
MITNTTSNLNVSNDKMINIKISEEMLYTLSQFEQAIEKIYSNAGMETNSINRSLIIKNFIELGFRSDKNILRIDRWSWSPKDILENIYPGFHSIKSIKDIKSIQDKEKLELIIIKAETKTMISLFGKDDNEKGELEKFVNSEKESFYKTQAFKELLKGVHKKIYKNKIKKATLIKELTMALIKTDELGVISLFQIVDSYRYNVLFTEIKELAEERVNSFMKDEECIVKIGE